jgi:hypothetical protein
MNEHRLWPFPVFGLLTGAVLVIATVGLDRAAYQYGYRSAVSRTQTAEDLSRLDRKRVECDQHVQLLLSTKDIVELERAKFLIGWFNCSVTRQVPPS